MDWLARLKVTLGERQNPEANAGGKINIFDFNTAVRQKRSVTTPTENIQHGASIRSMPQGSPATRQQMRSGSDPKVVWHPVVQSLVDWFLTLTPPMESFYLEPHLRIVDPVKFFQSLRREIETGPIGPRARLGTLQWDLRNLKTYFSDERRVG